MPGLLFCVSYLLLHSLQSRFFSSLKEFFLFACFTMVLSYRLRRKKELYVLNFGFRIGKFCDNNNLYIN